MLDTILLNTIETEIKQNKEKIYEKIIPMKHYSYETKITLDYLIEKYGALIKRYNDKIIIYIKPNKIVTNVDNSHMFNSINESLRNLDSRLSIVEDKLTQIIDDKNITNKNLQSYLDYFRNIEEKREIHKLVEEILNHH